MALDDEMQRWVEQAEAGVRRYQEEQDRYLGRLDFDWASAPKLAYGEIGENPLGAPATLSVELRDGRLIELREVHQYYVYQGTLCGVPPTPEDDLVGALKTAQRVFPETGMRPVMLEPMFHGGTFKRQPGAEPFPYPLVWLPKVCTIAQFESGALAREPAGIYSALVVVWFQDSYGMVDDRRTLAQLRELDWEAHAIDWSP